MTSSVTVIGGGVVGLCCALALGREGHAVTVVDDDDGAQAPSWGNAGHIATEQVRPLASWATVRSAPGRLFLRGGAMALPPRQLAHWLPFGARLLRASTAARHAHGTAALTCLLADALPAWRRLAASLPGTGLLRDDGHIVAWETAASTARGRAAWAAAATGTATWRDADPGTCASLARLAGSAGAIRFEGTGQITDLGRLRAALRAAVVATGGRLLHGKASVTVVADRTSISVDRDGASGSVSRGTAPTTRCHRRALAVVDGAIVPSDHVLVAAGVRSGALLAPCGHRVPLIAERGYHLRSSNHDWPDDLPPVVYEDRSVIVTRYAHCVQVASFVEFADADAPADPAKWDRLTAHIAALGLPIRPPYVRWMGARPTLPDYLPAIGRSRRADNLVYAFGHQHLGLTLAPITAEIVAAMVAGGPTSHLAAFDVTRFG